MRVSCLWLQSEEVILSAVNYKKAYKLPDLCDLSTTFDSDCHIAEGYLVIAPYSVDPECQLVEAFFDLKMLPPQELCGNFVYSECARYLCEKTLETIELDIACAKMLMTKSKETQ